MAELNGLIWWVIVLLAIVASVRGWKWRPWVFVAVTLVFRLGIESAIDQAASRVIGYTLSLDSESRSSAFNAASAVLSSEIDKYNSIILVAQLCVFAVMVVMAFNSRAGWAQARSALKAAAAPDAPVATKTAVVTESAKPQQDQLTRLDSLLKNQLITVDEYQERRALILAQEKELAEQREKSRVQRLTAPYAARLRAVQYFASKGLLTPEQVRERTDTVLKELM